MTQQAALGFFSRAWHSDIGYSFRTSPVAVGAALIAFVCIFAAVFANWVAPHHPFDLATIVIGDKQGIDPRHILGAKSNIGRGVGFPAKGDGLQLLDYT